MQIIILHLFSTYFTLEFRILINCIIKHKEFMKTLSKTLEVADYDVSPEMNFMNQMKIKFGGTFSPTHNHRTWEYGICLKALLANGSKRILQIGGSGSVFAASAALVGMDVTVVDPDPAGADFFPKQNLLLQYKGIHYEQLDFLKYKNQKKFDAVVCLGVLAHIADDLNFFTHLLSFVKERGLLFMTMDFHPSANQLTSAHHRTYNEEKLMSLAQLGFNKGFAFYGGEPDYSWKEENVASLSLIRKKRRDVPVVLFANHKAKKQCGVYQYGKRAARILERSTKCRFIYVESDSLNEFIPEIEKYQPNGIIYNNHIANFSWLPGEVRTFLKKHGVFEAALFHESHLSSFDTFISINPNIPESPMTFTTPRPLFEYDNKYPLPQIPVINSFGFSSDKKGFDTLVKLVNEQFDTAIINIQITHNEFNESMDVVYQNAASCQGLITKPGIQLNINHEFLSDEKLLDFLAKASINVFLYHPMHGRGCSSVIDYALSVRRPIAITKSFMFRHISDAKPSICVEDRSLHEIMATGFGPLEPYYDKWRPEKFFSAYEEIVESLM